MAQTNPYYTQQQVKKIGPYTAASYDNNVFHNQPYFEPNNQNNNQIPPPNYIQNHMNANRGVPPNHNNQMHSPPSANVMIIQNQLPPNYTPCPYCRQYTDTYAIRTSGAFVWLMCFLIMLITCCCWFIAFWINDWKDIVYRCRRCNTIKYVKQGGC